MQPTEDAGHCGVKLKGWAIRGTLARALQALTLGQGGQTIGLWAKSGLLPGFVRPMS